MTHRKATDDGAERIHIREIVDKRLKYVGGGKKINSNIMPPRLQYENYKMKTKEYKSLAMAVKQRTGGWLD